MKHTPGPWTAKGWSVYPPKGSSSLAITGYQGWDTNEANARLIAAAPAYHEAAEELAFLVLQSECYTNPDIRDAVNRVLAIHKQAEGKE